MILNWTSDHVIDTLLILAATVFVIWLVRAELEMRRFYTWMVDPHNEWRQILYAAHRVEMPPRDPTICNCRCLNHGYASGGMHFVACCEPCSICGANIAQSTVLSPNGFPLPGYRHEEHKRIAH